MTDLDVALRIRLAYDGAAAKPAVADMEAIRAGASKLAASAGAAPLARDLDAAKVAAGKLSATFGPVRLGRDVGDVAAQAASAQGKLDGVGGRAASSVAAVDHLAAATARVAGAAGGGAVVAADLDKIAEGAQRNAERMTFLDAKLSGFRDRQAARTTAVSVATVPPRLEDELAGLLGTGAPQPFRPVRPASEAAEAQAPQTTQAPVATQPSRTAGAASVALRPIPADVEASIAPAAVQPVVRPADTVHDRASHRPEPLAASARPGKVVRGRANGAQLGTAEQQRAIEALGRAADKLGAATGPGKLAEAVAAVTPAATEARRHLDDIGAGARANIRDLERMGAAAGSAAKPAAGGVGSTGGDGHGHAAAGGGGLRGALMAGARPLRIERLVASALTPVGMAGLAGGLGIAEIGRGLKAAEDQAISFEAAMVAVKRALGDIPEDSLKALQSDLLKASVATGVAKEEVAAMAATAARGGVSASDLGHVVERTAKVANVFGSTPEEIGERLTRYRKDWHADQARSDDTTDTIALLAQKNGADGGALFDFVNAGARLRANHVSARQVASIGATAQHAGIAPEVAQGLFGDLTEKLSRPEKAGDDFKNSLSFDLGINPSDTRKNMRTEPAVVITQVLDRLKAMPDALRNRVAERLLGPEQGQQLAKFAGDVDTLRRNFALAEDAAQRTGAVDKLVKTFDDTASAKIEKAGRAFESLSAKIGRHFLPAIGAAADGMAKFLGRWGDNLDASDRADAIIEKQKKGEALTPDQQRDADTSPDVRKFLGQDPDPAATSAETERRRQGAEKTIRDLDRQAKETQDPQIRGKVDDALRDYQIDFPGAPPPRFARGGHVTGPGGPREDRVHAMLSAGEFVIKASSAAKHHGLVRAINDDTIPAYADGGPGANGGARRLGGARRGWPRAGAPARHGARRRGRRPRQAARGRVPRAGRQALDGRADQGCRSRRDEGRHHRGYARGPRHARRPGGGRWPDQRGLRTRRRRWRWRGWRRRPPVGEPVPALRWRLWAGRPARPGRQGPPPVAPFPRWLWPGARPWPRRCPVRPTAPARSAPRPRPPS